MLKKKIDQSISSGDNSVNYQAARDINIFNSDFPIELIDQAIKDEVCTLRQSRFFNEYDRVGSTLKLAKKLTDGELSRGTNPVRSRALAWCSRLLSRTDKLERGIELLNIAKELYSSSEILIAESFILSQQGDKNSALSILSPIDSPASRTAAFMIVSFHDNGEKALTWLRVTGIEATNLDSEGKYILLSTLIEFNYLNEANDILRIVNEQDFNETPILYHFSAIVNLLRVVPAEFHSIVQHHLPINSSSFPLADDLPSMEARKEAFQLFSKAAEIARDLGCHNASKISGEYALWLELKNPETASDGMRRLENQLRDTKSALSLVHLGLEFGIKLDLDAVEKEIDRQIALNGKITSDAAKTRFALAFAQKSPEDIAEYISQHFDELTKILDVITIQSIQIEMLSKSGQSERANKLLSSLLEKGLSEFEEKRLRTIISESEGIDSIETRIIQFEQTNSLGDLVSLIEELVRKDDWINLCKYGAIFFDKTRTVQSAETFAKALHNSHKFKELIEFLNSNLDILSQSKILQMFLAWALYYEGKLLQSRSELIKLRDDQENPNYRALNINLSIAIGDWDSLLETIAYEYKEKDKRSAIELIKIAHLALVLDSPHTRALAHEAAVKANDSAEVLTAAYFLASSAGWEGEEGVVNWLQRAAELSGENGPIKKVTLSDILDLKPEWDRRETETWKSIVQNEIPLFLAAQSLNKSLIGLTILPAFSNLDENDPRHRITIPAFSGKRKTTSIDLESKTIGLDPTSLLTLSYLEILETVINTCDSIYIPHSTLEWLFEEKQKIAFHQPSRIKNAQKVRDLLAREVLTKFEQNLSADTELSEQVGDVLALLIADAELVKDHDDRQRLVVRSSPVHRITSLLEEEADLSSHASVLCSCLSVVEVLREKGQLTLEEEKKARAYLQLLEKPWLDQPEISDNAVLYLDDLTISYFLHIGILDKLHAAGFTAVVSPSKVIEINSLITYDDATEKATEEVERIRCVINSGIESGKIKVGKRRVLDISEDQPFSSHPSVGIIDLVGKCDAIITDDRFLNQHYCADNGNEQSPIFTTIDLLISLALSNVISTENVYKHITHLRRAGYFFLPITENELFRYLIGSIVKDGRVLETAELKAIRENILQIRMSDSIRLPEEAFWLHTTLIVFIRVLKNIWLEHDDLPNKCARSDWIADQVDVRGWAHSIGKNRGDSIVKNERGIYIQLMLSLPVEAPQKIKDAYHDWLENRILIPIKEQFPTVYSWIVEFEKKMIDDLSEMKISEDKLE